MSTIGTPPYFPTLPPSPADPTAKRIGTAAVRYWSDATPTELVGNACVNILNATTQGSEQIATIDLILTMRIVANGSATVHSITPQFNTFLLCSAGGELPNAYPYNIKYYEPAGVTAGTILYEGSHHYTLNLVDNVAPFGGNLYMSKSTTGGAHRLWWSLAGWTMLS